MASKRRRQGDEIQQQQHFSCVRDCTVPSCKSDMESFLSSLLDFRTSLRKDLDHFLVQLREEFERHRSPRPSAASNQLSGTSGGARPAFRLCFSNKMQHTYFTNSKILSAEDDVPVKIALFDGTSQSVVTDGPLSSIKIEICVLDADFGTDENWTSDEFNAKIITQREGKAQLLSGERFITLENGMGCVRTRMMLTDNSCWTRSRKFRLGAKVVKPSADVKEAVSDSFMVKDKRGEGRRKHDRPSLNDYVWRLRKVGKGGKIHNLLSSENILTVRDLLRRHTINPSFHQEFDDIPTNTWKAIMDHAMTCVIDEKERYMYQTTEQPIMILMFNCIYKVVGVAFDGQNYCHPDSLILEQKYLVEKAKLHAYKNVKNIIPLGETSTLNHISMPLSSLQAGPSGVVHQDPFQAENKQEGGDPLSELIREMLQYSPPTGGDFLSAEMCTEQGDGWSLSGLQVPLANSFGPRATSTGQASSLYFASGDGAGSSHAQYSCFPNSAVHVTGNAKRNKAAWRRVRTALKWVLSVPRKRERLRKINYC